MSIFEILYLSSIPALSSPIRNKALQNPTKILLKNFVFLFFLPQILINPGLIL
jgi:hypothetical protein